MPAAPAFHLSLADALTKLSWGTASRRPQPLDAPSSHLTLSAARNEVLGFQIHAAAEHDFTLLLDEANWLHPLGFLPRLRLAVSFADLPAGCIETFTIGYVEGDDHRLWMETLERSGWAEAQAGRTQGVYVRLRLPSDLPAGAYLGTVRAFSQQGFNDESLIWEAQVALSVSAACLPAPADFSFHLNLWQHCTAIARAHRAALWSEAHFALIERYFASLSALGQKALTIIAAEIPWSGQRGYRDPAYPSYLFEHSIIPVTRGTDGSLSADFSLLDRLLALGARHGIDREIDLFGLLNVWVDPQYGFGKVAPDAPDAIRVRCLDDASGGFSYLRTAADLRWYLRALHDHLQALGLLERVRVAADEPADLAAFNASLAFIQQAAPGFRYNAAINHYEFIEDAPLAVSDFIPQLTYACQDPQRTAQLTAQVRARGGLMLWYVCCNPPIPNTFLHSPLPEARLHGWLTHALGLDGFLRWAFCLWPADPARRLSWRAPDWPAGDMYFVLPGPDGAPIETLRYEALRAGIQDYELIRMAMRKLGTEQAQAVIDQALGCILRTSELQDFARVAATPAQALYSLDPADYHKAHQIVLEQL
jgi:hypothetical protein